MPTHPLYAGETGTFANALVARFPECGDASPSQREGGFVHRLDVGTSGAILAARNRQAYEELRQRFASGRVRKRYLALVAGALENAGAIDLPLRTMPGDPRRMQALANADDIAIDQANLDAHSEYAALQQASGLTLVSVQTHTGRRHQVRVHLAAVGHPLAGDLLYGGPRVEGLEEAFLHASELELLPEGERIVAPLPQPRLTLLRNLGFSTACS
jgi:23S rRNA pseudouridine1911/1915/1917 synthase